MLARQTPQAVRIVISGRVQGVGFRWFAVSEAERWGVAGYARNLSDGRVEVLAQAEPPVLDRYCEALRRGPAHARVSAFDVAAAPVDGGLRDFSIRYT